MARFNANRYKQKFRQAQRKVERQIKRRIKQINRANKKAVDDYNRRVIAQNKKMAEKAKRQVRAYNRKAQSRNKQVIAALNRQLRSSTGSVRYTETERSLADRVHKAIATLDAREYDCFLSYARIDGTTVAGKLREALEGLGVAVWFDDVAIVPGHSQALQMDAGLRKARTGIALLTPAYLAGRFWTERELGALLAKDTLIPVLHDTTFEDVREYSGILPDLAGFTTERDSISDIAKKIAAAVFVDE